MDEYTPRCETCGGEIFDVRYVLDVDVRIELAWDPERRAWDFATSQGLKEVFADEPDVECAACRSSFSWEEATPEGRYRRMDDVTELEFVGGELEKAVRAALDSEGPASPRPVTDQAAATYVTPSGRHYQRGQVRTCERCGREFGVVRIDARYCSNACRQAAYRERGGEA